MNLEIETKKILKKYNIIAKKNLGQNFLINEEVIEKIIKTSEISKQDLILEIGPGIGTLTEELIKYSYKTIAIEIDEKMIKVLKDKFQNKANLQIINDDILKVDLKKLIKKEKEQFNEIKNVKVIANLPYYITTPIIMKLLEEKLDITTIIVMIQDEVAKRLTEIPGGKYTGAITYAISYYTNPKQILKVKSESFLPIPEVDSSIIKLDVFGKQRVEVKDEKLLFKIIKIAFMQRRKTLVNCFLNSNFFENKKQIEKMLKNLKLDVKIRGEKLTLQDYANITNHIIDRKIL